MLGFWKQLLVGWPTEPAGAHLKLLRSWLATQVAALERADKAAAIPGMPLLVPAGVVDLHAGAG